ncbi:MAG: ribosome biogenesis GTPase YlqF [Clostridiales bacterium]|nr:ribosome biogenesis GTPase YlqF [Clostridiales bacterium]
MQHLQWFPGHMTAAMRMMEENLKSVDGVMIVLDARAPRASLNEKLAKLFNNKKVLYVLNKTDLVNVQDVKRTVAEFSEEGKETVAVSAMDKRAVDLLYSRIFGLLKEKLERNKLKGVFKPIRIMVAGIPNTGKSTIINALCGGKKAVTGNKAGVTKGKQWVRLRELELLDTPGTMPPAFENQTLAKHLAYIGSMNDANIDFNDLAYELLAELKEKYPELLKAKYGIENLDVETLELFNAICVRRGFLRRGNEFDYDRCATAIIDDFRKGRIGKIILD